MHLLDATVPRDESTRFSTISFQDSRPLHIAHHFDNQL